MNKLTKIAGAIIILLTLVGVAVFVTLQKNTPANSATDIEWKKYENKRTGFSVLYPSSFTVYERAVPEDNYYESAIDDPKAGNRFFFTRSYGRQSDIDGVSAYFVGPYPKQIPPAGNLPEQTAIERIFNGMKGVEVYGRGAEGHGFDDQFFYIAYGRLWVISLDPIIEGHATLEDLEPGTAAPTENYKQNYNSIWQSISISPTSVMSKEAALAQLRDDLKNATPHFLSRKKATGEEAFTPEEAKIAEDVLTLFAAQYAESNPGAPILKLKIGNDVMLNAIGKRYVLAAQAGAESARDAIIDAQTGTITSIMPNTRYYLAPQRNTVLYVDRQALYTYTLDQASAVLVPGSQLSGIETYHNGVEGLGIEVNPQQSHTNSSITVTIFDSSKTLQNPDGATGYAKVRETTLSF